MLKRRAWVLGSLAAVVLSSCKTASTPPEPAPATAETPASASERLAERSETIVGEYYSMYPGRAVELGLHEFDGKLREVSASGLELEIEFIEDALSSLEAIDAPALDAEQRVVLAALQVAVRSELFELKTRRAPWRNPMFYLPSLNLVPYIARDYAPLEQRARAIVAIAEGSKDFLAHARANLEPNLPRSFIDTALLQVRGTIEFVQADVPAAMSALEKTERARLDQALAVMVEALWAYEAELVKRQASATDEFALGAEGFVAMLEQTQGIAVELPRLREIGQRDLERNRAAMEEAARTIAPKADVRRTVLGVLDEKPPADQVLALAAEQATQMRAFLVERQLVTIPTEDVAVVVPSPPFMRWNSAFLDPAGVFETANLPSFYYISPPDPSWPKEQQQGYIPSGVGLLFTTIHEVWPGHFLHRLHIGQQPARALKSYWNYAMGEGWAHYAEQMMWDEGVSEDPKVRIGQLKNALLRNVRYLSAIGLHTGEMTVEQSMAMFRDQAFLDEASARQQAIRGTFDPMYLSYTLGKLIILELRDDWMAQRKEQGQAPDLRAFHDELLSFGLAPLPAIREAMLGPESGPLL